jgi:hypothetical protein
MRNRIGIFILGVLSVLGIGIILYHTQNGPGLSSDSSIYIQGARSIQQGHGFGSFLGYEVVRPITGFPPFFSFLLAITNWGNSDLIETGRWLNAILFGANVFLTGFLIQRCTQSILASSIGALLFLSSENLINIHSWVMSEGLFICLMLVLVLMLLLFIEKYNRFYLIASGIALTLLILTRYVGLGFIAAAGFVILISNRGNWKHQLKNILIFGTISILPVVLWFIRNSRLSGDVANRDFGLFPITRSWIIAYANQWTTWLFPSEFQLPWRPRLVLTFLLTIIILIGFVLHEYRLVLTKKMRGLSTHSLLPGIVFLCIGTYLIFFISSLFFLGGGNLPDTAQRYLSPVLSFFIILAICVVYSKISFAPLHKVVSAISLLYCSVLLVFYAYGSSNYLINPKFGDFGLMDTTHAWATQIAALQNLDPNRLIYSNDPELFYLHTNRGAIQIPLPGFEMIHSYSNSFTEMQQSLQEGALLVIYLGRSDTSHLQNLLEELKPIETYQGIIVYGWPTATGP